MPGYVAIPPTVHFLLIFTTWRAETCSAGGGGGGGTGALRKWGGVGKMGFRAGTLCYVVLAVLVQILPVTKSVVGWHDTPADG